MLSRQFMGKLVLALLVLPLRVSAQETDGMLVTVQENLGFDIVDEEDREGYVCCLVEYDVPGGDRVQSYLLVPDGASQDSPCPGIVLLHDHGARFDIGKEKLVRPLDDVPENIRLSSAQWVRKNFDGVYLADSLASLGYAVIVPDMLYWGSRSSAECREWSRMEFSGRSEDVKSRRDSLKRIVYEGQKNLYDSLYADGVVWAKKTLEEDMAAAALLASSGFVDKDRIAAAGWSMGAHRTWMLTAFSKDVSAGAALCWMTLKETSALPYKASDYAMLIPELRDRYDFPDIARFLAPKPFFFLNGRQDRLFPFPAVEEAFSRMHDIYEAAGCGEALKTEFFEGGHHCGKKEQGLIVDFLEKSLTLH